MDSSTYWDKKIIGWENRHYGNLNSSKGSSVFVRMIEAARYLNELKTNKKNIRILDLGCGTGRILELIYTKDNFYYQGVDISNKAIETARDNYTYQNVIFTNQNIIQSIDNSLLDMDICLILGLTDWLNEAECVAILSKLKTTKVLISFTQKEKNIRYFFYRIYRFFYDYKKIKANSYNESQILNILNQSNWEVELDLTTKAMVPGKLLCLKQSTTLTE